MLTSEPNPLPPPSPTFKRLCFLLSVVGGIALVVEMTTGLLLKSAYLPAWLPLLTTFSQWVVMLSTLGLAVVTTVSVVRSYFE